MVLDQGLAGILNVTLGSTIWVGTGSPSGPSQLSQWFANATGFRVSGVSGPFWLIPSALLGFLYCPSFSRYWPARGNPPTKLRSS